ncbi:SCO1431 family membrane protein [Streptomyces pathocidini]|uniref:SCO1431 family membrane protein n=1 Tax=Streptomyces pathocidini TaxID=1650571 RepID=A0ABW7UXB2_9ACTN|nr:SCO1431 family membrane protein [Streptomyces pathocidini]
MTAASAAATRTGGPQEDDSLAEHIAGWTLVVLLAVFFTQAGLL